MNIEVLTYHAKKTNDSGLLFQNCLRFFFQKRNYSGSNFFHLSKFTLKKKKKILLGHFTPSEKTPSTKTMGKMKSYLYPAKQLLCKKSVWSGRFQNSKKNNVNLSNSNVLKK